MGFPTIKIKPGQSKVVSCAASYAPLPWKPGPIEIIGSGGSTKKAHLSEASNLDGDSFNEGKLSVDADLTQPCTLKVNLTCGGTARIFRVKVKA